MEYDEDYLVALAILHGGTFWHPQWGREEYWIFDPGFNEHTPLGGRSPNSVSVRAPTRYEAALLYCERHNLLPDEVLS